MGKRLSIAIGVLVVIVIVGIMYVNQISVIPTDVKILEILDKNKKSLLTVRGVVGAGIARDENNHIIGIAVYVEDNMIGTQQIPTKLGEFEVFVKRIGEASEFEEERMIIRNPRYQLLNVTTDKSICRQNDDITITVKNRSNETVTFGSSAYDLFFQKWNGASWEFYTGVIGLEVITYLSPAEAGEIKYKLGGQTDRPFPAGKYRVISSGWLDQNAQIIHVWGYAEFTIE